MFNACVLACDSWLSIFFFLALSETNRSTHTHINDHWIKLLSCVSPQFVPIGDNVSYAMAAVTISYVCQHQSCDSHAILAYVHHKTGMQLQETSAHNAG